MKKECKLVFMFQFVERSFKIGCVVNKIKGTPFNALLIYVFKIFGRKVIPVQSQQ